MEGSAPEKQNIFKYIAYFLIAAATAGIAFYYFSPKEADVADNNNILLFIENKIIIFKFLYLIKFTFKCRFSSCSVWSIYFRNLIITSKIGRVFNGKTFITIICIYIISII